MSEIYIIEITSLKAEDIRRFIERVSMKIDASRIVLPGGLKPTTVRSASEVVPVVSADGLTATYTIPTFWDLVDYKFAIEGLNRDNKLGCKILKMEEPINA